MRSLFLTLLAPALLGLVLWTGCSSSTASSDGPFTLGEPLTDSTIALIVYSDDLGTNDTLFTIPYLQQVQMILMQAGPLDSLASREVFRRVAEGFVFDVLLRDLAKRDTTIPLDRDRARAEFANVKAQLGEDTVNEELARSGMTEDSVLTMLALQFRFEAMMQQVADRVAAPSAQEIEAWRAEQSQEVKVQHILLPFQMGGQAEEIALRTLATTLLDSAKSPGVDFGDLARRHSQDASAALGGELDFFSRGTGFPKPFTDAAFALQRPGDLSGVVEAPYGFHLIRLTERRLGTPPDTTLARRVLQGEKQNDAFIAYLDEAMRTYNVRVRINTKIIEVDLNNRYKED